MEGGWPLGGFQKVRLRPRVLTHSLQRPPRKTAHAHQRDILGHAVSSFLVFQLTLPYGFLQYYSKQGTNLHIGSWTESCPLRNPYVEALAPKVTEFGDRAFKEVVKVK